jgi:hypothetical protein
MGSDSRRWVRLVRHRASKISSPLKRGCTSSGRTEVQQSAKDLQGAPDEMIPAIEILFIIFYNGIYPIFGGR